MAGGTADTRDPRLGGQDFRAQPPRAPREIPREYYYSSLSGWDSYRVSLFVHEIKRAGENVPWNFGVLASSSADGIELAVLTDAVDDASEAMNHIKSVIRDRNKRLHIPSTEWKFDHGEIVFSMAPGEGTRGSVFNARVELKRDANFERRLAAERRSGKPFAVLLEPKPPVSPQPQG